MSSVATAAPPKERERVDWLDLFRGAAVLAMIETHVVNTFLAPVLREAAWFPWLNWFNGLIAPAFLFIAGYAQGMSWRANPMKPVAFGRKAKRLLGIAALGYVLHFPFTELGQHRWAEALRVGTQVDVLQCLAVTLLGVLGVQALVRVFSERRRRAAGLAVVGCLGLATIALAPYSAAWNGGPVPLAAFVNDHTGSLFPVFPWAVFVFCGVLAGAFASRQAGWMLVAAGLVKGGTLLAFDGTFSALSPAFFGERLAWVLVLAALCHWVALGWKPRAVLFAGRESLVMYAGHLLIIEGLAGTGVPHRGLGLAGVALIFAAVGALAFAVALATAKWSARRVVQAA
jgi:uncharacterized membrane protein